MDILWNILIFAWPFIREMAVRARGIIDHDCGFDKTSEEIYQDLCVDRTPLEVLL